MVVLHLDEATDGKALLGAYVCGDAPGEFRWQPGALAQALMAGRWLVLEDVDAAPAEVLSALIPLLEGCPLAVPGRAETLAPAPGFFLFGTVSARADGGSRRELSSAGLWSRVRVAPPTPSELSDILHGLYPRAAGLVEPILHSLAAARALCGQSDSGAHALRVASIGRDLTLRDAVKWGRRMTALHGADVAADAGCSGGGALSVRVCELAFMEGADLLAGVLPRGDGRDAMLASIAAAWALPSDRGVHYETLHKPAIAAANGVLFVGLARLEMHTAASTGLGTGFAVTGHAARTLERLAVATACCEPVLLVGETGTGKTAAVQALARAAGARLVVVNMSTQSDSADLLGGFKPREPGVLCLPLAVAFSQLFADTFPRELNSEFASRVVRCVRLPRVRCAAPRLWMRPRTIFCQWRPRPATGFFSRAHMRLAAQLDLRSFAIELSSSSLRTFPFPPSPAAVACRIAADLPSALLPNLPGQIRRASQVGSPAASRQAGC
jgi:midasin